jgi:hypothetical protein
MKAIGELYMALRLVLTISVLGITMTILTAIEHLWETALVTGAVFAIAHFAGGAR